MNVFDNASINLPGFAYRDLLSIDRWESFTLAFTSLTVVGATTYTGRYRFVGAQCFFQAQFSAATSVASTAGTTYLALPRAAQGVAGIATMTNGTTKVAVGTCHIDVTNSRCYPPTQGASGNTFTIAGWFEI